jgi:hypothetical protein
MGPKFLAPAVSHKAASFISVINLGVHFSFSLKILAFLWHQSTQHTKIPNDLDPRLTKPVEFAEIQWIRSEPISKTGRVHCSQFQIFEK